MQRDGVIAPLGGKLQTYCTPSAAHFISELYSYNRVRTFARALLRSSEKTKKAQIKNLRFLNGGRYRTRTCDILCVKQTL